VNAPPEKNHARSAEQLRRLYDRSGQHTGERENCDDDDDGGGDVVATAE